MLYLEDYLESITFPLVSSGCFLNSSSFIPVIEHLPQHFRETLTQMREWDLQVHSKELHGFLPEKSDLNNFYFTIFKMTLTAGNFASISSLVI